jgi:hypothetical protein
MITHVILDFDGTPEQIPGDEIYNYSGRTHFESLTSLEALVDTSEESLTALGDLFPNLEKFRLNNSIIPNVRDIGCSFSRLRFLWLPRCGLTSLNGISTLSQNLQELYVAFNQISDVSDLMGMDKLKILDLEDNKIQDLSNVQFLTCCPALKALTLAGNPCTFGIRDYAQEIARLVPNLIYLDETRIRGRRSPLESAEIAPAFQDAPKPIVIPPLRLPRAREAEDDDPVVTEFVDDQVHARPPTARGRFNISLGLSPRRTQNESMLKSFRAAAIVRPLASGRRVTIK